MHQGSARKLVRQALQALVLSGVISAAPAAICAEEPTAAYDIGVAKGAQKDQGYLTRLEALNKGDGVPLTQSRLVEFKELLKSKGWPTTETVGREGIDIAGQLLRRASGEFAFQAYMLELLDQQVDVDIDPAAYAHLSDLIYQQHGDGQIYGTLLGIDAGKVVPMPAMTRYGKSRFFRDFYGLASLDQEIEDAQKQVDAGKPVPQPYAGLTLSKQVQAYARPDIREALGHMIADDQEARLSISQAHTPDAIAAAKQRVEDADRKNLPIIKAIFNEVGFPNIAMVGRDGVSTVFLIVQHADDDPAFQQHALELAKPLMEQRQLSKQQYAMLSDRVRLASGRRQLYGTQVEKINGAMQPRPVEDPDDLDARRKQMSMGPIKDYLDSF